MKSKLSIVILLMAFVLMDKNSNAQIDSKIEMQNVEVDVDDIVDSIFSHYICSYAIQNNSNFEVETSIVIPVGYYLNCDTRNDFVQDSTFSFRITLQPNRITKGSEKIVVRKYPISDPEKCDALNISEYKATFKPLAQK